VTYVLAWGLVVVVACASVAGLVWAAIAAAGLLDDPSLATWWLG
jgi:hypothetical protein